MTTIHPTAVVDADAQLGEGVEIGPYCVLGKHVTLGDGVRLRSHVVVDGWTRLGPRCDVFAFASLGTQTQDLKYEGGPTYVEIGAETTLREYVTVNSGTTATEVTRVGSRCHIMAYAHVAHGCTVGDEVVMANCATLAGHVEVADQAIIGGLSGVHQFVRIGRLGFVGGCVKVTQDVPPFIMVDGNPAVVRGLNKVGLNRRGVEPEAQRWLRRAYSKLYREKLSVRAALEMLRAEAPAFPEAETFIGFVESAQRGIVRPPAREGKPPDEERDA